jgi:SAM-dependent methyltransferase
MFGMITGFWVSQLVGGLAAIGVMDAIAGGARTAEDIARATGSDPGAMRRVLRTAASLGLVRANGDGTFAGTPLGDTLRADVPGSMRGMAVAQTAPGHWLPWGRFADALRTGTRQTPATLGEEIFGYYGKNPDEGAAFSDAMNGLSSLVSGEVARLVDTRGTRRVVDVGGANGTLVRALLEANPALSGVILELPHVVPTARDALRAAGLAERCEVVAGDFFADVPEADLYVLKAILHDWDDAQSATILGHCARRLRPGGRVMIVEMVIPDDGRPSLGHLMDINMLTMLPGQERTGDEYRALLATAGLRLDRILETHSPFQIIEASRA